MSSPGTSSLANVVAIVVGAAAGIGRGVVIELEARGAVVVAVDIDGAVERLPLDFAEGQVTAVRGDVRDEATLARALQTAQRVPGRLGVLVYSALAEERGPLEDISRDGWQRTLDVLLTAPWRAGAAFVRTLDGAPGAIVNVGSVHAHGTLPGFGPYAAAKAGLQALTRAAALEWGPRGVRVNGVSPGFVRVARNEPIWSDPERLHQIERAYPIGRVGEPVDVARVVAFLASSDAGFVNGTCIPVDGGMLAALPEGYVR
jgi:NAD(P)-dependent dehydrogenase (short-subunit alcohol dehydrogenase family)